MHAGPIIWSLRASKLGRYRGWKEKRISQIFFFPPFVFPSLPFPSPLPFSLPPSPASPAADGRGDLEGLQFA